MHVHSICKTLHMHNELSLTEQRLSDTQHEDHAYKDLREAVGMIMRMQCSLHSNVASYTTNLIHACNAMH